MWILKIYLNFSVEIKFFNMGSVWPLSGETSWIPCDIVFSSMESEFSFTDFDTSSVEIPQIKEPSNVRINNVSLAEIKIIIFFWSIQIEKGNWIESTE